MKVLLKVAKVLVTVIYVIGNLLDFLCVPALLVVVGLLNHFGYRYYIISLGAYLLLVLLVELIAHLIAKALNKKYTPRIHRKLEEVFSRCSKDQ